MDNTGNYYICNWAFGYGSASSNRLLAYAKAMRKKGVKATVIVLLGLNDRGMPENEKSLVKGLPSCGIKNKLLSSLYSLFSTIFFLLFTVKKADKILLYGSAEFLPIFYLLRRSQLTFEVTESPDIFHPRTYPFVLYKKLWRKLPRIVVISKNLKQYFIDNGVSSKSIKIINMIVDASRFSNIKNLEAKDKYIAYCGNVYSDDKDGVKDLLNSFALYHKTFSDRRLCIIGSINSSGLQKEYLNLMRDKGIDSYVSIIGMVSPFEIPTLLSNAEMLVLSRPDNVQAKFGFPTKVGEYLLSGRPIVVTDVGNITDFLKDGINAYLTQPGDYEAFAKKMVEVSSDTTRANEIGRRGRETALLSFNSEIESLKLMKFMNMKV